MPAPIAPDAAEMQNRQLVSQMAMQGSAAKQQAPSIATAPEAMQTAMARSAGVNAPAQFNATQTGMIQNPYARADSELAANSAGGVLGAINNSTADYMQQAQAALPLQEEISKRAVQKMLADQAKEARSSALDERRIALEEKKLAEQEDPNSLTNRLQKAKDEAALKDLGMRPLTNTETARASGVPEGTVKTVEKMPQFSVLSTAFNDMMKIAKQSNTSPPTADQYNAQNLATINQAVADGEITPEQGRQLYEVVAAQFGSMLPGYKDTSGPTSQGGRAAVGALGGYPVDAAAIAAARHAASPVAAATAAGAAPTIPHWQEAQVGVPSPPSSAREVAMIRQAAAAHGMTFDEYIAMLKKAKK